MDWLRLLRSRRVGVVTFWKMIREHRTAQAALEALPEVARAAGVSGYQPCPPGVVLAEMKAARQQGARLILCGESAYPALLAQIPDAPPALWVIGDPDVLQRPMVALVGARNASSLGLRMARRLADGLVDKGFTVVSGLARGVDATAHLASLNAGTVAVQAGGVDVIYPSENTRLGEQIVELGGVRLSEQPMGMQPLARHFPLRNRIISGLCQGVVVVEAAARSGSLITARGALDQGREVMAVPGHPMDTRASGCNMLIRDGAHLVRGVEDIVEALPLPERPAMPRQAALDLPKPVPTSGPTPVPTSGPRSGPTFGPETVSEKAARAPMARPSAASRNAQALVAVTAASRSRPASVADPSLPANRPSSPRADACAAPPKGKSGNAGASVPVGPAERRSLKEAADLHQKILNRLSPSPTAEDQLIRDLGATSERVAPALTDLELAGRVRRQAGGFLTLMPRP